MAFLRIGLGLPFYVALRATRLCAYCAGVTTVVVVEVGGATGSVTVVVRLTVVLVVEVGGGVVTTSSLEQATRETPKTINGRRRLSVCISVECLVFAPNGGLLYFGRSRFSAGQGLNGLYFGTNPIPD